ncbi:Uncharacterised protein [Vibrio cholerae]|nr:Uncharacterised protein [Vibrio cholerae]
MARFFWLVRRLRELDLPVLERPANAISIPSSSGRWRISGALVMKCVFW